MVIINRNGQQFGPYDEQTLITYVNNGQILLCDEAILVDAFGNRVPQKKQMSVKDALKLTGYKPRIPHAGSFMEQIKKIGMDLIIPRQALLNKGWMQDNRLLLLAIVGLTPSVLMLLPMGGFLVFYCVALYFSMIWGLFFYYFFKTPQVKLRTTATIFFATQIFVFCVWDLFGLNKINFFYMFVDYPFPINALGYIFGVGLTEEFIKALPLFILIARAKQPYIPQTLVYYGLMSGIGFGVFEGVQYQMMVNVQLEYSAAFFMNIARLTSLPFLHAIWCGIAGYFIAFSALYPKYRLSLWVLAIGIPMTLHGLYDTFCGSLLGLVVAIPIMALSVFMLITYLKQGTNYQLKLRN